MKYRCRCGKLLVDGTICNECLVEAGYKEAKIKKGPNVKHYNSHPSGIECIEIAQHHSFNIGNAIKYLWRQGLKVETNSTESESSIKDLRKAIDYINFEIQKIEKQSKCQTQK